MKSLSYPIVLLVLILTDTVCVASLDVKVYDQSSKEEIPFAPVLLINKTDTFSAQTTMNGKCRFNVPKGRYIIKCSSVGYQSYKNEIVLSIEKTELLIPLVPASKELDEVLVIEYYRPLIDKNVVSGGTVTKEEYSSLPTKNIMSVAATTAGVISSDEGKEISIRGCRGSSSATDVYIDGVKVRGSTSITESDASEKVVAKIEPVQTNFAKPGMLTATELNDFAKWEMWKDFSEDQLKKWQLYWDLSITKRFTVLLMNEKNRALIDIPVALKSSSGEVLWAARTDNTGKAELWNGIDDNVANGKLIIEVTHQEKNYRIDNIIPFEKGINRLVLKSECTDFKNAEFAFVVDATSSMVDEIDYLRAELGDIIQKINVSNPGLSLRTGSIFYRDHGDQYVTKTTELTGNYKQTLEFIEANSAAGGGDVDEAMDEALEEAISNLKWSENALSRMLFLILDAPAHNTETNKERLKKQIRTAAEKGIKVIPILCSGGGPRAEYLLRVIELATNGSYIALTDHSGIGEAHEAPTTDESTVTYLNDLIIDIINRNLYTIPCNSQQTQKTDTMVFVSPRIIEIMKNKAITKYRILNSIVKDTLTTILNNTDQEMQNIVHSFRYYPNPTVDNVTVEVKEAKRIFLCDFSGKILQDIQASDVVTINLEEYPTGTYIVRVLADDRWLSGNIIKQ